MGREFFVPARTLIGVKLLTLHHYIPLQIFICCIEKSHALLIPKNLTFQPLQSFPPSKLGFFFGSLHSISALLAALRRKS
jgi:hypothetical protein